ncbi:multidrug effflux MFS transporter [Consotaella salsifontis]|uniref:Bcr/CflA family efflux transporter n=1 Tax=Consotaella salsifontis TaxID=1365950 RepID=A0A1T4LDF9_9HYPH|nr:multidrug effflux MFS transporter [Consotaella salsifontis]SJZ52700.1 MFS transporter, DHA1 family, bicyclomycin/chloramphenicol resistance protein [Consotaella salsifontis]
MNDAPVRDSRGIPYWELVTLVASLMALNSAAIDIFIPALQNIGQALNVESENSRQLVISSYMLGFGVTQIFYGPLSDRFGRKPLLYAGLSIYAVAALASIFAPTFGILLLCRALQGTGTAATRVIAISVVRDCFGGRQMASVMSLVMMVFMVIPVVAPNVGQLVLLFGSWREISLVIFLFGMVVLAWVALRLPETLHPEDRRELNVRRVREAFGAVFTNRIAFGYTLAASVIFGVLFAFINQAEQIYTEVFSFGPEFTLYFSAVAVFMAASSFLNSRLVRRFGMRKLSHAALIGLIIVASAELIASLVNDGAPPFWLFFSLFVPLFCFFGFIGTNFNALAMDPLGHIAGTASSALGFLQTVLGGLLGATIGFLYNGTLIPLFGGFVTLGIVSLGLVFMAEGGRLFTPRHLPAPPPPATVNAGEAAE